MGKHGSRSRLPLETAQVTGENGTGRPKIVAADGPKSRKTLAPDRSTRFSARLQAQVAGPHQALRKFVGSPCESTKTLEALLKELSKRERRALQLLSNLQDSRLAGRHIRKTKTHELVLQVLNHGSVR